MSNLPNFKTFCREACIKLWGEPDRATAKELRWNGADAYSVRTFNPRKGVWYDAGQQRGGSTLELVAYAKGEPASEVRGPAFFDTWQEAHKMGLVPEPPPRSKSNGGGKPIGATYPYHDEQGELLFEVVRFDTTDPLERFRQRRPDGKGGWIWNTKGTRQVLNRLPELIAAVEASEPVLVTEGERDANSAVRLGYAATTNPGGIDKWRREYDDFFNEADVVVVSDNDSHGKGQAHAAKIAKRLAKVAARVRTIIFPHKDLTEWVEAGGTREQLDALIAQAPEQAKHQPQTAAADGGLEDRIALDFSARHVVRLRYVAVWNKWLQWNGAHWVFEDTLHAFHLARELCRDAEDARHKTVSAVVGLARADRRQAATTAQWDTNSWLLGTPGGTIDLRTGLMRPPDERDYITKIVKVTPAGAPPDKSCPLWLNFLDRVTAGNKDLQAFLQRMCGYCLTGVTTEDALFFLYGLGANGKSVFLRTVSAVVADYHKTASMEMFTVTHSERHPTDLAMLRGARLVTAIETEEGKRWDESKLKTLTGGDPIAARFMRQDFFEYVPQFKLLIAGNHKPVFRNVDEAIRRRVKLCPFTVTIPEAERDQQLSAKLRTEWPGVLRWMIDGCLMWQRDGLNPPAVVKDATDSYLTGQDDLQQFIDDACVVGANEWDTSAHLWDGWTDWAEDNREFIGTQRRFSDRLLDKGFDNDRSGKSRTRVFLGIRCIRENAKKMAAELRRHADEARAREAKAKANAAEERAANVSDAEDIPF